MESFFPHVGLKLLFLKISILTGCDNLSAFLVCIPLMATGVKHFSCVLTIWNSFEKHLLRSFVYLFIQYVVFVTNFFDFFYVFWKLTSFTGAAGEGLSPFLEVVFSVCQCSFGCTEVLNLI